MPTQTRLNRLAAMSSIALGATTATSVYNFTKTRRPSDAVAALTSAAALAISVWISAQTRTPHLWSVGDPSNVRHLNAETG